MTGFLPLPADLPWVEAAPGVRRAVLAARPELMLVAFRFEAGAVGARHSHPHVQTSLVAEGTFDVTVGGATRTAGPGDSFVVGPDVVHGVVAHGPGLLIDAFAPWREDFLPAARPDR